jgi:uncharacterized protein (DUF2237 family)
MIHVNKEDSINVLGGELQPCSTAPLTGFFRDGSCNTCSEDVGSHTVCIEITTDFLEYSRFAGNDLSSPQLESGFPGLKEGDRWCLCASRWLQAHEKGMAPKIFLKNTHRKALATIPLALLDQYAVQLNLSQADTTRNDYK